MSVSVVVGILPVLTLALPIWLTLWGLRFYLRRNSRWTAPICPVCGNPLRRHRRLLMDRVVSLIVPVRRYRCDFPGCRWMGWRVKPLDPLGSHSRLNNGRS